MWMEVSVENWQDFLQQVEVLQKRDWIFRGQSNADWSLQTSFYREMKKAELIGKPLGDYLLDRAIDKFYRNSEALLRIFCLRRAFLFSGVR